MIPDFKTYIKESAWGEMRRRSAGKIIRKEDDIDLLDKFAFRDYLQSIYDCEKPYDISTDELGVDELNVCVFRTKEDTNFQYLTVHDYNTEPYITFNIKFKSFFEKNYNEFDVWEDVDETSGNDILVIRPKDDKDYTNSFFIKVLDFLLTYESKTLVKLLRKK